MAERIVVTGPPGAGKTPEPVCLQRIESRVGHGFSDLAAARHMYGEFERARTAAASPITSTQPADSIATAIEGLLAADRLRLATRPRDV